MKKREILKTFNLDLDDKNTNNFEGLYNLLVDYSIFTNEELKLVTCLNGARVDVLLDALFCRCGLRSIEQLVNDLQD